MITVSEPGTLQSTESQSHPGNRICHLSHFTDVETKAQTRHRSSLTVGDGQKQDSVPRMKGPEDKGGREMCWPGKQRTGLGS